MKNSRQDNKLNELAVACGIQLSYRDMDGRIKRAPAKTLLAAVRALGVNVAGAADCRAALDELQIRKSTRVIEPVLLAWEGRLGSVNIRLPQPLPSTIEAFLELDCGETRLFLWPDPARFELPTVTVNAGLIRVLRLPFKCRLPFGYHRLSLIFPGKTVSAFIISAPRKAPELQGPPRRWGLFSPVYALRSGNDWGAGGFSEFTELAKWSATLGSGLTATLPLLPAFYREHFNPSPYSPVSRLFWNELFIDVPNTLELTFCPAAAALLASKELRDELSALRAAPLVDYAGLANLKRKVLELLAECFFNGHGSELRRELFNTFVEKHPEVKEYARFRAYSERSKCCWRQWPEEMRDGSTQIQGVDLNIERYHLYVQFIAREQLAGIVEKSKTDGQAIYLDLPLGSNPDGFDTWKHREIFVTGSSVGAPPDDAFPGGQDWGFPPPHPERQRETEYRYLISVVRHHLEMAGILRLDHIMGLHRLYWIPEGSDAADGVYVRYAAEEMYAILCLEAFKAKAVIVGEDLGLVPGAVRRAMRRHNIKRSYVAQYEMLAGNDTCLDTIPVQAVAAVNTHDMHPFAAFWQGTDIPERVACGVLSGQRACTESARRSTGKEVLTGCLLRRGLISSRASSPKELYESICRVMASSDVEMMLISLDDLGGSTKAQNIPGTYTEHPNWRRRTPLSLERLKNDQQICSFLKDIDKLRK
ncbi:4-alpha-glucanotransferase [Dehalogenimonas formicexedens]|uniref:4-alpha-glucanotransferase n=1 Tax=Dehalogenimonas formicexedens TaxID=1839801 RepID=A0A1P8F7M1_9CHLR|nr:4-alpha-glucanotransferase [Dehalogenimonas formicexedens]APV44450.1 4-alpha-glucanotransferase [Dehalogenimonas formicexedens]